MDENMKDERVEELNNVQPEAEAVQPQEAVQAAAEPVAPVQAEPVAAAPKQGFAGIKNFVTGLVQKLGKKVVIGIAAAAGVLVIGGVAAAAAAGGSPVGNVFQGAQKTVESVGEIELFAVLEDVLNGGSIEVSMNTEGVSEGFLDMDVLAKVYTNLKDKKFAFSASASMDGSEIADANAWVNEKDIIVSSESLLDDVYGVSLKKLEENLEDSALLELMGMDFEEVAEMMALNSDVKIDEKTLLAFEEDLTKLLEKVAKQFGKSLKEYAEIEKGKKELSFNGEKVNAKTVEVYIEGDALAEVIGEVAQYLYDSKDLEALLDEYAELVVTYLAMSGEEADADEIIDSVYESLDTIIEGIDDFAEDMEEMEFTFVAYLKSDYLLGFDFKVEEDSDKYAVSVLAGPSLAELKEFRVTIEEYGDKTTLVYTVDANDSKEFEAGLKIRENGKVMTNASVSWDKKAGDYKCKLTQTKYDWWDDEYTEEYAVSGSLLAEKDCYILEIKKVSEGEDEIKPDVTICFDRSDKQPSAPKYVEVLTLDEEELLELKEDIVDEVKDLIKMFR